MIQKLVNIGIQLIPLNNDSNYELIDNAISLIKKHNFKTVVTPFETAVACTYENGLILLQEINELCSTYSELTWLVNIRIHSKAGFDVTMESKTQKHL
jgi:uncharacterized protein YqgV (UPF0045/DUF77 family)